MRWWVFGAVIVALVLSDTAEAAIVYEGPRPYQRWLDRAPVEPPARDVEVIEGRCPLAAAAACTQPFSTTIYVGLTAGLTRGFFFHEMGHQYDYWNLTDRDRERLLPLLGHGNSWRYPARRSASPHEIFAEAYKQCAIGHAEERTVIGPRRLEAVCRFVD